MYKSLQKWIRPGFLFCGRIKANRKVWKVSFTLKCNDVVFTLGDSCLLPSDVFLDSVICGNIEKTASITTTYVKPKTLNQTHTKCQTAATTSTLCASKSVSSATWLWLWKGRRLIFHCSALDRRCEHTRPFATRLWGRAGRGQADKQSRSVTVFLASAKTQQVSFRGVTLWTPSAPPAHLRFEKDVEGLKAQNV